jgi:dCMP deaminase
MLLNAGIERVVIRDNKEDYRVVTVADWITNDDSLTGEGGY